MEFLGEMPSDTEGAPSAKVWYRCAKCRQAFLYDLKGLAGEAGVLATKLNMKECTEYSPTKSYTVGEAIYHSEWSDAGKVKAKERTSSGAEAILVAFEKLGERRLIENFKSEEISPMPPDGQNFITNTPAADGSTTTTTK